MSERSTSELRPAPLFNKEKTKYTKDYKIKQNLNIYI